MILLARNTRECCATGTKIDTIREPMYLLDTDVMIDIQRKFAPAVAWFNALADTPSVPGFVVMELIQKAQNKQQVQGALPSRLRYQLYGLLKPIAILH